METLKDYLHRKKLGVERLNHKVPYEPILDYCTYVKSLYVVYTKSKQSLPCKKCNDTLYKEIKDKKGTIFKVKCDCFLYYSKDYAFKKIVDVYSYEENGKKLGWFKYHVEDQAITFLKEDLNYVDLYDDITQYNVSLHTPTNKRFYTYYKDKARKIAARLTEQNQEQKRAYLEKDI